MNRQKFLASFIATLFCWLSVAFVVAVQPADALSRGIVVVVAFWITAELWLAWARSIYKSDEKDKHHADENLALLVQLMDDEERRAIKQRLIESVRSDGETSSLEDLLADQDRRAQQRAN